VVPEQAKIAEGSATMRAQFVLQEVWTGLRRNLTMTIALIVVVAISLSLLGTGLLFVKQVDNTRTYWQGKVQLSVYLCTATSVSERCHANGPTTAAEKAQIQHDLQSLPQVQAVYYESQNQAFAHFKQDFSRDRSFTNLVTPSELPDSFQVKLINAQADYSIVAGTVAGRPGVDQVVNDAAILSKFYRLLDAARNAVVIIAVILLIAAVLLVANTIRLSAFNRRRETSIMRLVGASNFYVQLPFLVEGILAGLAGWLIAAGLLVAVKNLGLDALQQYFSNSVQLSAADLVEVIVLAMVMGVLLCGATSFLTLRRYLRT
jgi:cell division transport system permease protein